MFYNDKQITMKTSGLKSVYNPYVVSNQEFGIGLFSHGFC